jgi:hypothetical protein
MLHDAESAESWNHGNFTEVSIAMHWCIKRSSGNRYEQDSHWRGSVILSQQADILQHT